MHAPGTDRQRLSPSPPNHASGCILQISCDSAQGQMAAICHTLDGHGAYLHAVATHDDTRTGRFFVRIEFSLPTGAAGQPGVLHQQLSALVRAYGSAQVQLHDATRHTPVILMVSKMDHCLNELLSGRRWGELPMDPVAIVSNHLDCQDIARVEGIPFHHLAITPDNKPAQEARLRSLVESTGAEYIVLARYMQVLSDGFVNPLLGRIINIHHSFLPGFKGARPYEQAWERGVKLIGATAHFVTPDLDEGPIIEQAVEAVTHADLPERLVQRGRHVESRVLRQALRHVLERRVFLNGTRTIVLH